jgi:hypothetical protein
LAKPRPIKFAPGLSWISQAVGERGLTTSRAMSYQPCVSGSIVTDFGLTVYQKVSDKAKSEARNPKKKTNHGRKIMGLPDARSFRISAFGFRASFNASADRNVVEFQPRAP